jgi:hypothetical protein
VKKTKVEAFIKDRLEWLKSRTNRQDESTELGESRVGNTDLESFKLALYGLCEQCAAVPDVIQIIDRKVFEQLRTRK